MSQTMHFLGVPGRVADDISAFDWSSTSLGPPETWPPALVTTLRQVLATRQPMCFWWGDDLLQFYNDAYLPMLAGRATSALGQPFREYWGDVWDGVEPFVLRAQAGEGTWIENLPLRILRNGVMQDSFWTFSYSPLYDDQGAIAGILNVVTETTSAVLDRQALQQAYLEAQKHLDERERHEDELKLLNRELAHRMKNTLAMVQSIVSQSLRGATSIPEAATTIGGRIQTLAKAQDVLTGMSVTAAEITAIARTAVAPHVDGDDRISVRWSKGEDNRFTFDWQESGGPPVTEPSRRGFGSRLTERVVSDLFQGQAAILFEPTGVSFSLIGKLHNADDLDT